MAQTLRQYQSDALNDLRRGIRDGHLVQMLMAPTGAGKCLGKGTPVLMFDGTVRAVEDVSAGELLMGPDSKPRRVLSTCRGRENLYRVIPTKGDSYVVNESHILSLRLIGNDRLGGYEPGIVNIGVSDYLQQSKTFKHCAKGWRTGVDFASSGEALTVPPYIVGAWLGDGTTGQPHLTTADSEVAEEWADYAAASGHDVAVYPGRGCSTYRITRHRQQKVKNSALEGLRELGILFDKHIPHVYKTASRQDRLELLAGIVDTDGFLGNGYYDLTLKQVQLANDVAFLARSLGLAAYVTPCRKVIKATGFVGEYFRVSISGNVHLIPCRVPRRIASPRKQIKNVLNIGITVDPIGEGDYYGFEIDGDRLFLLGDFTVTHNTTIASAMKIGACAKGKRAFFIVDSLELVDQAAKRFYEDGLEVGVIQGDHSWTDYSKPIQVCTIQTLRSRWKDLADHLKPDLVVIDEAHVLHKMHKEIIAECVERKIPVVGLSATPFRKGLGQIFGRLVVTASLSDLTQQGYLVPAECYAPHIPDMKGVKTTADGDWAEDALAEVMGSAKIMGDVVTNWIMHAKDRQTVVFACNVAHSRELARQFNTAGILAAHVDGYMDEQERAKIIKNFRHGSIRVLCNVAVLTKGFDAPETSCVVLARPTKSLMMHYQMMGRGLRPAEGKSDCIIIDHAGNCLRNGVPTEPLPAEMDMGAGKNSDRRVRDAEKSERLPRPCPKCQRLFSTSICPACGFKPEPHEDVEWRDGKLVKIGEGESKRKTFSTAEKEFIFAQFLGYAQQHGHNPGWAWHKCREYCGSAPRDTKSIAPRHPTPEIEKWIRHINIKWAKRRAVA
ncbi:DEAD/DEAH box helicase family protein [Pseudomonas aeruginosa]|uniref:DEAD/DEAH box helicase family protein n=2 Tax=Pseudomonas aeruginosa TaxID=287 RepID=UPI001C1286D5|nr:DEAD/DEAH box helicase family protein [Pseudomonas aeruginosa]MBU5787653.1 DEAD/DEAH box helicase family protein [Pseudomonas aeruginosa]